MIFLADAFMNVHDLFDFETQDALRRVFDGWLEILKRVRSTLIFLSYCVFVSFLVSFSRVVNKTLLYFDKTYQDTSMSKLAVFSGVFMGLCGFYFVLEVVMDVVDGFEALWAYVATYLNLVEVDGCGRYQVAWYGNDDGNGVMVELFDGEPQVIHRDGMEPVYRNGG